MALPSQGISVSIPQQQTVATDFSGISKGLFALSAPFEKELKLKERDLKIQNIISQRDKKTKAKELAKIEKARRDRETDILGIEYSSLLKTNLNIRSDAFKENPVENQVDLETKFMKDFFDNFVDSKGGIDELDQDKMDKISKITQQNVPGHIGSATGAQRTAVTRRHISTIKDSLSDIQANALLQINQGVPLSGVLASLADGYAEIREYSLNSPAVRELNDLVSESRDDIFKELAKDFGVGQADSLGLASKIQNPETQRSAFEAIKTKNKTQAGIILQDIEAEAVPQLSRNIFTVDPDTGEPKFPATDQAALTNAMNFTQGEISIQYNRAAIISPGSIKQIRTSAETTETAMQNYVNKLRDQDFFESELIDNSAPIRELDNEITAVATRLLNNQSTSPVADEALLKELTDQRLATITGLKLNHGVPISKLTPFSKRQMEEEVSKLTSFNATSGTVFLDLRRLEQTAGGFHDDWKNVFKDDAETFDNKDDLSYDQIQLNENNPGAITFIRAQRVDSVELNNNAARFFTQRGQDAEDAANSVAQIVEDTRGLFNGNIENIDVELGIADKLLFTATPRLLDADKIFPKAVSDYYSDRFDSRRWEEGMVNTMLLRLGDSDIIQNENITKSQVVTDTFKMLFTNNAQYAGSPVGVGTGRTRPIRIEQEFMGVHELDDLMGDLNDANRNPFDIRESQKAFRAEEFDLGLSFTIANQQATALALPLLEGIPGTSLLPLVSSAYEGAVREAAQGKFPFNIDDIQLPDSLQGIEQLNLSPEIEESFIRGIFGSTERFKKASLILNNAVWLDDGDNMVLTLTGAVEYDPEKYGIQGDKILIPDQDVKLVNKNTGQFISMRKQDYIEYTASINTAIEEANKERIGQIIDFLSPLQKMFKIDPFMQIPISP